MSKKRILIVDDNEINRALLRKILSSQYDVLEAENGLVALEVLATIQNEVSALLLDLTMPVLDGYELLRRLRANEDSMLIPIIVLTETESEDSELQALALGANDFLKKPYQPDLIRQRLSNMIMFGEMVVRQRASRYDRLTGIYTREMFCIETARMLAEHSDARYTMVCMDVEQFKVINDLFGIAVGDAVLKNIAHTLASYVSTSGTYGRLEGDHFVCCVPSATLNIEILMNCMDASFRGHGFDYKIVCYYGLCEVENSDTPVAQLCDWAALALASIKGNYMKRFAYYDNALREVMLTEQQIVSEMNDALEQHEFTINLQPIYSISMECPVSAEALVRWQHPRRGLISPGVFIPLFERKGFITRLDWFVREQVCCYIKRSKHEHPELKIVPISVNLSRMNFYHTEFPNEVIAQTQQYGVLPSEIKFEITESAYTDNPGELLRAMKILQDYGFEIMMDDFGSGYSSLNMLKDVPVDVLKIDMKFVDDIEVSNRARNVMASVVRMAKWLDMSVIAEGVETRTQIDFLRSIGCDRVQGFYFSKPLSLTDFTELILSAPPVRYADGDILEKIDFDTLFYDNREINLVMDGMIGFMGIYELRIAALEVVRVNKGYYELFGNAAFATSRDVMENVMPADRAALLQKCHDAEISLRVERLALRSYRENKIVFWLDLRVRYLGKRNGNSIFYFAGNDITKQKEMEQANA
ncbi:MAG: EAL domain-containing protein, partial [Pygmaiobacter sp.]